MRAADVSAAQPVEQVQFLRIAHGVVRIDGEAKNVGNALSVLGIRMD